MWVLILILYSPTQGANSAVMHDFADQAACMKAMDLAEHSGPLKAYAYCTPKASAPAAP